jgi:hypothetical protein
MSNRAYTDGLDKFPPDADPGAAAHSGRPVRLMVPFWCISASSYADGQHMMTALQDRHSALQERERNPREAEAGHPPERRASALPAALAALIPAWEIHLTA